MSFWQYEQEAMEEGRALVCGCDEAGAGPLAGPVYAAAVILPVGEDIPGLDDSKKLTPKQRDKLFPVIQERALDWSVAWVDAKEIDETDILSARMRAMQLAIDGLSQRPDFALVDGNRDHGKSAAITTPHRCLAYRRPPRTPPPPGEGGQPVRVHRGGLHPGQGEPGPVYGDHGAAVSGVPL